MKNGKLVAIGLAPLVCVAAAPAAGSPAVGKALPRVLLIGDSISGGYAGPVAGALKGKATVRRVSNGGSTIGGLVQIERILGNTKWDVIHFNWGLHDMTWQFRMKPEDRGIAKYEERLEKLVVRLKKTGAKLIWGTTTPWCPEVYQYIVDRFKRELRLAGAEERKWEDAALRVMKKHDIRVNDLYALMLPELKKYLKRPDDIHFNAEGSRKLGKQIAAVIRQELETPSTAAAARTEDEAGTKAGKSVKQLQADFLKLKFGMFICFNMETYVPGQWASGYPDPSTFDPGGMVDTDAWADAAVAAGMKYAVLTTKHTSGFCLWDSKYTTYDVMHPDCPYKQDLVAQFVKSFKSRGRKVGLYYCWRHPGFDAAAKQRNAKVRQKTGKAGNYDFKVLPPECDPATHSLKEQIAFQKKQIAELIEKYPDVFYVWNDALDPEIIPAEEAREFFRGLKPDLLASANWWDWSKKGMPYLDIVVSETRHLESHHLKNGTTGETCWCLERKWFYTGAGPKPAKDMVTQLNKANSRKANFLLNVGPDEKGRIPESSVKTLAEIGKLRASEARAHPEESP